ncbi:DUF354 domain-containing protein [Methanomethylovorans sp.]|uniref:DUF354 domain-containing protein n=1 Tax=Methanomethylovorans sp. TaxID=2758717 RepID=UPI00345ECBEA
MKIVFGISHPKHVFIFKNVIEYLIKRGHNIKVIAVDKEISKYLLTKFNINYSLIGKNQHSMVSKLLVLPHWEYLTYKLLKNFKPDLFVGRAIPHMAHISAIMRKPYIVFEDTEIATTVHKITLPFASAVVTPLSYKRNHGKKHHRFDGFFEHGYLAKEYFTPDSSVLDDLNVNIGEKIILVRFVAWKASHDIGDYGFQDRIEAINDLVKYGKVFISSEETLPTELKKYELLIPYEKIHHLMYFSDLFIGESATMATECAILGTPSIYISTSRRGYTDELEKVYNMLYTFSDKSKSQNYALQMAIELLSNPDSKKLWKEKSKILEKEKIDVTKYMCDFIEDYNPV